MVAEKFFCRNNSIQGLYLQFCFTAVVPQNHGSSVAIQQNESIISGVLVGHGRNARCFVPDVHSQCFNERFLMASAREFHILVLSRKTRKRADQMRVEQRHADGLCLMKKKVRPGSEERIDCSNAANGSRGLCKSCQSAYERFLDRLPADKRQLADNEAVSNGWILAPQEKRALNTTSVLSSLVS